MPDNPTRLDLPCRHCGSRCQLSPAQNRELLLELRVTFTCHMCGIEQMYRLIEERQGSEGYVGADPDEGIAEFDDGPELPGVAAAEKPRAPWQTLVAAHVPPAPAPPGEQAPPPPFGITSSKPAAARPFDNSPAPPPWSPAERGRPAEPAAPEPYPERSLSPPPQPSRPWKERLANAPPWVQWALLGLAIVGLAVVVFALPFGGERGRPPARPAPVKGQLGSADGSEKGTPPSVNKADPPAKSKKERSKGETPAEKAAIDD